MPRSIEGVLEHNRHDLVSLAGVMSHALWLAQEGPDACREPGEQLGARPPLRTRRRSERARLARTSWRREPATATCAVTRSRGWPCCSGATGAFDEAAAAWQGVLGSAGRAARGDAALERRAAEALAIHHEHRARDLAAREALRGSRSRRDASGRARQDVAHRLGRLDRKLQTRSENGRGPPGLGRPAD